MEAIKKEQQEISVQGSVEPSLVEPMAVPAVIPSVLPNVEPSTTHSYSTRSKDDSISKSMAKQKEHNVVVHPRLKPVLFKNLDLRLPSKYMVTNKRPAGVVLDPAELSEVSEEPELGATSSSAFTFYNSEDQPLNRRGYKYKPCTPNPLYTANLYSTTEIEPYTVHPSHFDRAQGIIFSQDMASISTVDGWRSIRTNIGIREGSYYMEFAIVNANNGRDRSHVRVGIARREAALEAPVGFDGYGYGLRDVNGQKITLSRPKEFMKGLIEDPGFHNGDVIGLLVELPSLNDHKRAVQAFVEERQREGGTNKSTTTGTPGHGFEPAPAPQQPLKKKKRVNERTPTADDNNNEDEPTAKKLRKFGNVMRDQIPIKYRNALYYEQFEYTPTKKMEHLLNPVTVFGEKAILERSTNEERDSPARQIPTIPQSKVIVYKNGELVGTAYQDLYSFLPLDTENESIGLSYNERQLQNPDYQNTDDGTLGYYPMVSVYQHGVVRFNAGPEFQYPPPSHAKPLSDRYAETVTEEWLWDIIDEVEALYLDSFE